MTMMRIFLDDKRDPKNGYDKIIRSHNEFEGFIKTIGLDKIDHISFDHDLGLLSESGKVCANLLVDLDMAGTYGHLPETFTWNVHSANPVGAENIRQLLSQYFEFKKEQ